MGTGRFLLRGLDESFHGGRSLTATSLPRRPATRLVASFAVIGAQASLAEERETQRETAGRPSSPADALFSAIVDRERGKAEQKLEEAKRLIAARELAAQPGRSPSPVPRPGFARPGRAGAFAMDVPPAAPRAAEQPLPPEDSLRAHFEAQARALMMPVDHDPELTALIRERIAASQGQSAGAPALVSDAELDLPDFTDFTVEAETGKAPGFADQDDPDSAGDTDEDDDWFLELEADESRASGFAPRLVEAAAQNGGDDEWEIGPAAPAPQETASVTRLNTRGPQAAAAQGRAPKFEDLMRRVCAEVVAKQAPDLAGQNRDSVIRRHLDLYMHDFKSSFMQDYKEGSLLWFGAWLLENSRSATWSELQRQSRGGRGRIQRAA
jgi:hypothetical protein